MGSDLQPEFVLLRDAEKRFKLGIEFILALAGESKLTLWACYTAEQFNSQITFRGRSKNEYWALGAADIRELRTVGRICIKPPAHSGLVDSEGNFAQLSGGHESLPTDVMSPVPDEPVYFRKSIKMATVKTEWLYVRSEELTAVLDEYRKAEKDNRAKELNFAANTILGGIYKRLHPNGKWKNCSGTSFQEWIDKCLVDQMVIDNGFIFSFGDTNFKLVVDAPTNDQALISAGYHEVGVPTEKLQDFTAENLSEAIKPNKIKRLLDNPSFQFIKGCTF